MLILRRIGATVLGLVVIGVFVNVSERITHALCPPPAGVNLEDFEQVKRYVGSLPARCYLTVLTGWLLGILVATFLASRIGRSRVPAYVIGALVLVAGAFQVAMIPEPLWYSVAMFVAYLGGTLAGARLGWPAVRSAAP